MEKNIFENAYFGKPYKTRDGKRALFIEQNNDKHFPYSILIEGKLGCIMYDDTGKYTNDCPDLDIVSEWKEEVNEEELDELALKENPNSEHSGDTYESGLFYGFDDGFKAGVRYMQRVKEEK